jgi:hypothetical protein
LIVAGRDPATGARELTHLIARSTALLDGIRTALRSVAGARALFGVNDNRDFEFM